MKIIRINQDISQTLKSAAEGERKAQKIIYDRYNGKTLSICRQYVDDTFTAEDLMITVFLKIFRTLHSLENKDAFEPWLRRITINECISHLRLKKKIQFTEAQEDMAVSDLRADDSLMIKDLQSVLDSLPYGCKTVFNLYVIDGYKHHEIATMMDISEGTSKSQLAYARKLLQEKIYLLNQVSHG